MRPDLRPPRWRDAAQTTAPPHTSLGVRAHWLAATAVAACGRPGAVLCRIPVHPAATAVLLVGGLVAVLGFPLVYQALFPGFGGFGWGWAGFLLGIPLLSAALVVGLADQPPSTYALLLLLVLPVFMVSILLHLLILNTIGYQEPLFWLAGQVVPLAMFCAGSVGLAAAAAARRRRRRPLRSAAVLAEAEAILRQARRP